MEMEQIVAKDMSRSTRNPYEFAMELVETTSQNVFLTGRAGTGKTTFLKEIRQRAAKRMAVLAPTGVAAINAGGATVHSFFQLPFGLCLPGYQRKNRFKIGREKALLMQMLDLLVIDEVSMLRADTLDEISGILQRFRKNDQPFGGVQLLLIGDLQQLSPIVKEDEWLEMQRFYDSPYFFHSKALCEAGFSCVELTTVYRQTDRDFIGLLEKIRNGNLDRAAIEALQACYKPGFEPKDGDGYVTLTTHNFQSEAINNHNLEKLGGKPVFYRAEISGTFPESSFPTMEKLCFKPGAQVMFVKNDSGAQRRYYNGKIGRVKKCLPDRLIVESEGSEIEVLPEIWRNTRYKVDASGMEIKEEVEGTFLQIPLKPAWAITIHKSQGLTFDKVVIDAGRAFAHGQVYVALSRCRSLQGVVLLSPLTQEALVSDVLVENFARDARYRLNVEDLSILQQEYRFSMLCRQFDFSGVASVLRSLRYFSEQNFKGLYPRLHADIPLCATAFDQEVYSVAERFKGQLFRLRSASEEVQDERCYKAASYFREKMEVLVKPLVGRLTVELDNRQSAVQLNHLRQEMKKEVREKEETLGRLIARKGFSVQDYLRARSVALAEFTEGEEQGGGRKKKITDAEAGVALRKIHDNRENLTDRYLIDNANPALVEKLRLWRRDKSKERDWAAFRILTQKTLLAIAAKMPRTPEELLAIKGIGKGKAVEYGSEILGIVASFLLENPRQEDRGV